MNMPGRPRAEQSPWRAARREPAVEIAEISTQPSPDQQINHENTKQRKHEKTPKTLYTLTTAFFVVSFFRDSD
jgi:hypothetical protein